MRARAHRAAIALLSIAVLLLSSCSTICVHCGGLLPPDAHVEAADGGVSP